MEIRWLILIIACVNTRPGPGVQYRILPRVFFYFILSSFPAFPFMMLENSFLITNSSCNFLCYFWSSCKYFSGLRRYQSEMLMYKVRSRTLDQSALQRRYVPFLKKRESYPWIKQSNSAARRMTVRRLNTAVLTLIKGVPEVNRGLTWA